MAGNHFSVTFDAQMNVSQIKGAINDMKKGLEGLKLPDNMEKKIGNIFSNMSDELKRFESLAARDLKSPADFNKLNQSGEKILHLYQRLRTEISSLSDMPQKSLEKLFPSSITNNIDKATAALKKYKEAQAQITNELSNRQSTLEKKQKELSTAESKHKEYMDKTTYKQETGRLEDLLKQRQLLDSELNRRAEGGRQRKSASDYTGYDMKKLKSEYSAVTQEVDKLQQKLSKVTTNAITATNSESNITRLKTEIKELQDAINSLEGEGRLNLDNLFSALEGIDGIDLSNVERNANGAQEAINKLNAKGAQELLNNLNKIGSTVDNQKGAFDGLENSMHQVGAEVEAADAKFRDVSAIKSRIAAFLSVESAVRLFRRAITSSFETIKELDATMTETAVVTDFSVSDMWKQLPRYTKMANELGVTTNEAYKAATLYYQQGLSTNQAMAVSNETLKMARIAGIDAADATDYMTAALRGFNMEINEVSAQRVNDVYSKLAAETASDTEELSIAMSKTASIAANANMEFENTAAFLAQIIETTREAPETAGTAMKTIIARFSEVKSLFSQGQLLGTDEEGEEININKIDTALQNVGISLKDFLNGSIGLDDVLLQLASKWDTLDLATQRYIATTAAGSRQQSRFLAMMSNYSRTVELVDKAYSAEGAGQEQFEKTLDSMETALARLKNAWDQFAMGIMNSSIAKGGIHALTGFLEIINKLTSGLGDLGNTVTKLGLGIGAFQLGRGLFDILASQRKGEKIKSISGKQLVNFKNIGVNFKNDLFETVQEGLNSPSSKKLSLSKALSGFFKGSTINAEQIKAAINRDRPDVAQFSNRYAEVALETFRERGREGLAELEREWGVSFNSLEETAAKAQLLGVAATFAGGAMLKLGNALESAGHTKAAEVFDTLGTAVMTAGVALSSLSVIIPAIGNLFPALGAKIAAAGLLGLSGWLWIAGIAAAVGAIGFLTYKLVKGIKANSLEGQIESTEKAVQRSREEADKAQSAYDELLNTKASYNDLQEGLANLTTGTQEWSKALVEANQQVLDLVNKYPKLSRYLEMGDKGQLSISDKGWNYVEDLAERGVKNSQAALINNQLRLEKLKGRRANNDLFNAVENETNQRLASYISKRRNDSIEELVSGENFAKTFKSKDNANLRRLAQRMDISVEQAYNLRDSFAEYNAAMVERDATTKNLAKSLLTASSSKEVLDYKFSDQLFSGISENMISDSYDKVLTSAASEISDVSSERFKTLAEDYGVSTEMVGNAQKDLETLYAAMKNIDVKSVSEAQLSTKELSNEIAAMSQSDVISENLDVLTKKLRGLDENTERQLAGLFSGDFLDLTGEEVANLDVTGLTSTLKNALGDQADSIMQSLGYESFDSFAQGVADNKTALQEAYAKNISDTLKKINKYSDNLVSKLGEDGTKTLLEDFTITQEKFRDMGLEFQSMANGIFNSLEGTENIDMISAGWQSFIKAIDEGATASQISEMSNWIQSIDWSNPIEGAYALGEAANSSSQQIKNIANSMKEVQGDTYDAASQMDYFLKSGDFESMKEDLKDILNAGEEITGADIRGLTKNYKNLDKMLKNTGMSASALGKTLTMINDGSLKENQLTNAVLAAIGAYNESEDVTASIMESISNFDPGYNEGEIAGFIKSSNEAISELMNTGLSGSQQIGNYLDYWFGADWDAGIKNADEYTSKIQQLNGVLSQNTENMAAMWQQFAQGKDAFGNMIDPNILNNLGFSVANGRLNLDAGTSLDDVIKGLQRAGYTKNMAEAMLSDATARSPELMLDLRARELPNAIERARENLPSFGKDLFIMDESEIDAIAKFYGESSDKIKAMLQENGKTISFVDLYDESGNLKDVESVWDQLGSAFGYKDESVRVFDNDTKTWKKEGKTAGENFRDGFNDKGVLDLAGFEKMAKKLRIPEEGQKALKQDLVQSFADGAQEGVTQSLTYLSEVTGREETIPIQFDLEGDPVEQAEAAIKARELELEAKVNADAIMSALEGIEIHIGIDENGLVGTITRTIESASGQPTLEQPDSGPVTSAIASGIRNAPKTVALNAIINGLGSIANQISAIVNRNYTVYIGTAYTGASGGPIAPYRQAGYNGRGAKGVKNASHSSIFLTGEEGPEIHQLAKGGYYITGTTGPSIDYVNKGDTIYTAEETEKILSGNRRSITRKRFSSGADGSSSSAIYPTNSTSSNSSSSGSASNKNKNATESKTTAKNTQKAAEDAEKWENSFDHLYNLTQDINAELRTREKLEKQYNRYQKERIPIGKTLAQISKSELYSLEQQRKLQEQMLEERKKDIKDTEEKYKDYNQYAHYNWKDQTIEIDWDKINAVTDKDQGEKIEEYIDKLEEIQDQIQDTEDAIDKIYDDMQEIRERGEKANRELQDDVLKALIDQEQKQIDLQEKTNQAISDAANDLHEAISKNIDKMRQDRDNERKKEDLAEKERRLSYLKMDTTGGNALAIKRLEKEIRDEREEFNDALVDQALSNMQEQNEEAADQRERQVELLQGILDFQTKIGYFAKKAEEIVDAGTKDGILMKDSKLYDLLVTENDDFWTKSIASRNEFISELATRVAEKFQKDELINSERNLNNGGYMTQMMNATSAEQFRQAEEARNAYINDHPEEGWATTGFSEAYQEGQINKKGLTKDLILGGKDSTGYVYDFQALMNKAIKEGNWEEAAMWEGYRDLKLHLLNRDSERTYGSQSASAYANATGSRTSSGEYGTAKDQGASHGTSILEEKARKLYETNIANLPEPTTAGGYMELMQQAMDRGRFDEAFAYAKKRDAKIGATGKAYNEQDSFAYVYRKFAGYGDNWQAAWDEYKKGYNKGYENDKDYKALATEAMNNSKWKDAFYYAGQRDKKLATDPSVAQYRTDRTDDTWEYVFRKWNGKFKTGGLVEGTGLAWLDGTPSRPEYVLNAGQTQAFLRLSDMISNLGSTSTQQTVGDTYINVDINVDQIANDYDVETAAEKVKQIIYQDSMYRNVNRVNLLR